MKLPPSDWWQGAAAQRVMATLEGQARFVGGAVRDALLEQKVQDVDLATVLLPGQVLEKAQASGLKAVPTGIRHGTVTLSCGDRSFEVTTLRRDTATDGRHAEVAFTDCWKADAMRRDFTFNALYADATGQVYDPMGGLADLMAGRVIFLGEARCRIKEDYLRILRYFRFFARYARLPPSPELLTLLTETAPGLDHLSPERIWSELKLLLAGPKPEAGFDLMQSTGILARLFPEARLEGTRILAALPEGADWAARLLALFPEGADLPQLAARWRWSRAEMRFLAQRQQAAETTLATPYPLLRRFGNAPLYSGLDLRRARGQTDREAWRDWISVPLPPFPIRAADLQALGVAPGPAVGQLLRAVEIWWESGHCHAGRTEALAYLQNLMAHPQCFSARNKALKTQKEE